MQQAEVVYSGALDEVDVPLPGGANKRVKRGTVVKLPAGVVKSLVEQEDWKRPKKGGASKKAEPSKAKPSTQAESQVPPAPSAPDPDAPGAAAASKED